MRSGLALVCAVGFGAAAAAEGLDAAAAVDAQDPARFAELIRGHGYRAELAVDEAGEPMILTGVGGLESAIYFFGCADAAACESVLFRIGFDLPEGATLDAVNAWNRESLVGKAYLDAEADPYLEYFIALDGGVSPENLGEALRWWSVAVRDFRGHIDF